MYEKYYACDFGTLEKMKELSTKCQAFEESINGSSKITPAIAREMAGGITSPILQVHMFPVPTDFHLSTPNLLKVQRAGQLSTMSFQSLSVHF